MKLTEPQGIYVASRVHHASMWRGCRADGFPIISTWIDEAGAGETACFADLWDKQILPEIERCCALVLYAEEEDLPLKGALIEAGIAMAFGRRVYVVAPWLEYNPRGDRRLGTWMSSMGVMKCATLFTALSAAAGRAKLRKGETR